LPFRKQELFSNLREKSNSSQPQSKQSGELIFSQVQSPQNFGTTKDIKLGQKIQKNSLNKADFLSDLSQKRGPPQIKVAPPQVPSLKLQHAQMMQMIE
jgi:hypothetical protein